MRKWSRSSSHVLVGGLELSSVSVVISEIEAGSKPKRKEVPHRVPEPQSIGIGVLHLVDLWSVPEQRTVPVVGLGDQDR